jgi:hypothetical protein
MERAEMDADEHSELKAAYQERQNFLVDHKVLSVALKAIATHDVNAPVGDAALDLVRELLHLGNRAAQLKVVEYICEDRNGSLVRRLAANMKEALELVEERQEETAAGFVALGEDLRHGFDEAAQWPQFFKELCEGHCREAQDVLRGQLARGNVSGAGGGKDDNSGGVNLVETCAALLVTQADSVHALREMDDAEIELLRSNLEFLVEASIGPCPGNQTLVATFDGMFPALKRIMVSQFEHCDDMSEKFAVKAMAVQLIAACFENRQDQLVHDRVEDEFVAKDFERFRVEVTSTVHSLKEDTECEEETLIEVEEIALAAMCAVKTILYQLCLIFPEFKDEQEEIEDFKRSKPKDLLDKKVSIVEVVWNDRVEVVCFPVPEDVTFLSKPSRTRFLNTLDVSTADKRMHEV